MRKKTPKNILNACTFFEGLSDIAGGVTYAELVKLHDEDGRPAIHLAIETRQFELIIGGVTAKQLAKARYAFNGDTALHLTALYGILNQITGRATAQDLIAAKNNNGWTALHTAVHYQVLDQIKGGVTIQQLFDTRDNFGNSAIFDNNGWEDCVKEELKFEELAAVSDPGGRTLIHVLAEQGKLDKILGGVTASQLAGLRDKKGITALQDALISSPFSQIKGGLQSGLLKPVELNNFLKVILSFGDINVGSEAEKKVYKLIGLGADKNIVLEALRNNASNAQKQEKMEDWQLKSLRCLMELANNLKLDVIGVVPPNITAQLI